MAVVRTKRRSEKVRRGQKREGGRGRVSVTHVAGIRSVAARDILRLKRYIARKLPRACTHESRWTCFSVKTMEERVETTAALEASLEREALSQLQELLVEAGRLVCPAYEAVWYLPKERVRTAPGLATGPNLGCRAPATIWRKLVVAAGCDEGVRISSISDFGTTRETVYKSACEFATAIVQALPPAASKLAAVRVRPADGSLLMSTQMHLRRQRAAGLLHCSMCGLFLSGDRGLRDHQQIVHGAHYDAAKRAVHDSRAALVPYSARADDALLAQAWAERAAEHERAKHALSSGLRAARDGDLDALKALVADEGWVATSDVDRHGSSALMWAAGSGHLQVCKYLVEVLGVPPGQVQQKDGRTALHWAARNGHLQVCRWLVRCGISPDVRTHDGTAPLHWAVWQRRLDVCRWLVDEAGADLHAQNSFGCNAFQWAAQTASDDLKMAKWLLVAGLDPTLLNRNGHSAVHKAAVKGHRRICEWLLSDEVGLGAAHLKADQDGNTPARMAAFEGFDELARYLQEESERKGVSNVSVECFGC